MASQCPHRSPRRASVSKQKHVFPMRWNRFFDVLPPHSGRLRHCLFPAHLFFRYRGARHTVLIIRIYTSEVLAKMLSHRFGASNSRALQKFSLGRLNPCYNPVRFALTSKKDSHNPIPASVHSILSLIAIPDSSLYRDLSVCLPINTPSAIISKPSRSKLLAPPR